MTALNTSTQRILRLLKHHGAMTSGDVAERMAMTSMGARQHLLQLQTDGIVSSKSRAEKVGRPSLYWQLTREGHAQFTDGHDTFSAELISAIECTLGDDGLRNVLVAREQKIMSEYKRKLIQFADLERRLFELVTIREQEGYMASYTQSSNGFILTENHCPICTVAQTCHAICQSELTIFKDCFDDLASVSRLSHVLEGSRHCVYQFTPKKHNQNQQSKSDH